MNTTTNETWRPVVGAEGFYEVSSIGAVRRVGAGQGARAELVHAPTKTKRGYLRVELRLNGKRVAKYVQELVLEAFVGPRPTGLLARHLNGNPEDCSVGNLAWGTQKENMADAVRHGTSARKDYDVSIIRDRSISGREAARRAGVSQNTAKLIRRGLIQRHEVQR